MHLSSETGLSFHTPTKELILHYFFNRNYILHCFFSFLSADLFIIACTTTSWKKGLCHPSQMGNSLGYHNWLSAINTVRQDRSPEGFKLSPTRQRTGTNTQPCKAPSPDLAPHETRGKIIIGLSRGEISAIQNPLTHS